RRIPVVMKDTIKHGKIIGDTACPSCRAIGRDRTGNHLMLFEDGGAYCNRCGYSEPAYHSTEKTPSTSTGSDYADGLVQEIKHYQIRALPDRKIVASTCEYFGVRSSLSELDGTTVTGIYFPRSSQDNPSEVISFKKRTPEKTYVIIGSNKKPSLWGQHKNPT